MHHSVMQHGENKTTKTPLTPTNHTFTRPAMTAILISGQRGRFIFRDSNTILNSACDIFVRLQDWDNGFDSPSRWTGSEIQRPPYPVDTRTILQHYRDFGGGHVEVAIMSNTNLTHLVDKLAKQVKIASNPNIKQGSTIDKIQWLPHSRMFLLRHLVFQDALLSAHSRNMTYERFLYLREDNVFVHSTAPTLLPPSYVSHLCSQNAPCVVVDKYCGWGALSDKIYWANHAGASVLFGGSWDQFVSSIHFWVWKVNNDLQTERFLTHWMKASNVTIHKEEFHRTEKRYIKWPPKDHKQVLFLCVTPGYFDCTPNLLPSLMCPT
jgi:hypothetical protein